MGKSIDLTNKVFGTWTCINHIEKGVWLCRCENGHERKIQGYFLRKGEIPKCKECKASELDNINKEKKIHVKENLIGSTFGNWIVIGYVGRGIWKCKCSCPLGTLRNISYYDLKMSKTKSCGCLKVEHFKNSISYKVDMDKLIGVINAFQYNHSYLPSLTELSEITGINRGTLYTYLKDKYILCIRDNNSIVNSRSIVEYDNKLPEELLKYSSSNKIKLEYVNSTYDNELYHEIVYHQNKAISAIKSGVDLVQIFEYEWLDENTRKKLIKLIERKLYTDRNIVIQARKCEIRETEVNKCKEFLELNHLQGFANSSINIGLYFDDDLVGLMTFGKPRFNSDYQYELIRLAWKNNIVITGGAERLFSYFINRYKPDSIISYCDLSKFKGAVYEKLGFNNCGITRPSYVWYNPNTKVTLSRYQTIKSKLIEQGIGTADMSEIEIMHSRGFVRIFDCGNIKFIWTK